MRTAALSLALLLSACGAPTAPSEPQHVAPLPQSVQALRIIADLARLDAELEAEGVFAAGIGETVDLGSGLTVTPLEIVDDPRCPADVVCETSGPVRLRANVSGTEMQLDAGRWVETQNGWLVLAVVTPSKWIDWPEEEVRRPPYRFGFRRG